MTARATIIALILVAQTVANVGPLGVPAIAPLIRRDLGLSLTETGSLLSAYYVGPVLISMPAGALADRWGVRGVLVLGQLVIGAGLAAVSGSRSYAVLAVVMMIAGSGYGMLNPTSTKAVMAWAPPLRRATMIGLKQVGLPLGGALGAVLLPALSIVTGWRAAVVVSAILIVVMAVLTWLVYRDPPVTATVAPASRERFAVILRSRDLWMVAIATGIFAATQTVWMAYLVLDLEDVVQVSLLSAARYLALAQLSGTVGRVAFGVLSDRVFGGRRRVTLTIAGCGSAICSVAIAVTGAGASAWWLMTLAIAAGFVAIGWNGVQHTLMAELAGPRAAGTAVGLGLAISSVGVMIGPPIFGWCVERVGGYRGPWIALAVTMLAGLAVLSRVGEPRRRLA